MREEAGGEPAAGEAGTAGPTGPASPGPLAAQALLLAAFAVWVLLAGVLSPAYGRLYAHTHSADFDERGRVRITPPPEEPRPPEEASHPAAREPSPPAV